MRKWQIFTVFSVILYEFLYNVIIHFYAFWFFSSRWKLIPPSLRASSSGSWKPPVCQSMESFTQNLIKISLDSSSERSIGATVTHQTRRATVHSLPNFFTTTISQSLFLPSPAFTLDCTGAKNQRWFSLLSSLFHHWSAIRELRYSWFFLSLSLSHIRLSIFNFGAS